MKRRFLAMLVAAAMLAAALAPFGAMADTLEVTKTYFDISFENWTTSNDNNFNGAKNSDNTAINHDWEGQNKLIITTVSDREGKVLQAAMPTSGEHGSGYMVRTRMKAANHPSSYSGCQVLWNEFSIKYKGGFIGFGTNENDEAKNIIHINSKGELVLGSTRGYREIDDEGAQYPYSEGTLVPNGKLELGKWYNIAVAADFTDPSAGVLAYVWINGELIAEGITIPGFSSGTNWAYNKLWFDTATGAGYVAYIDDVKIYETNIIGTHIEDAYKVSLTDSNLSDYITVDGTTIKTPSRATLADVKAAFPEATFKFVKNDAPVTDDTMGVSGVVAHVYSPNGLVSKAFTLSPDPNLYTVTVADSYAASSGEGRYSKGDVVTINAGSSDGQKFTGWTAVGYTLEISKQGQSPVSFIMTATNDINFTANWETVPTYAVDVIDSFAQVSGARQYYEGQDVTINAGDREGYTFGGWEIECYSSGEWIATSAGDFDPPINTGSKTIQFKMDTVPKRFTAIWNAIPKYKVVISGSYAGDSGAGEYYAGDPVTIKAGDTNRAQFNGWSATGVTLGSTTSATTSFEMPANNVSITANWSTYSAPSGGGGGGGAIPASFKVNFETNGGSAVDAVSAKKGDTITFATPAKEGFTFDGWYLDAALTQKASSPYEVSANVTLYAKWAEKTEADDNDAPAKDDDWLNPFNDVKESSWYFEPIKYMYERQYCEGFGWGQFGPDVNLSRGMLVTILYRIEEQPEVAGSSAFADIEDGSWYEAAVTWAAENGIVTGYNGYSFAPNDLITREQIATILYRYAQLKGQNMSGSADISAYGDSHLVSSYARSSLEWAVAEGYLNGRAESTIAPADYATRAEALTVLYRFIKQ